MSEDSCPNGSAAKGQNTLKPFLWYSSLVMLFCVASWFVLSGPALPSKHSDSSDSRVIARVGGHSITLGEAERQVALPLYQLDQQRSQLLQYSVQQLIDAELLRIEANRTGQTIEQLLASPSSFESDTNHPTIYDESLSDSGKTISQRRQALVTTLRRNIPIQLNLPQITEPVVMVSTDDDPSVGPAVAPITIVEFSDFQCPFSKRSAGVVKEVLRAYGQKVRFVYRDYPAPNHVHASRAAEAAQCAAAQGKFWIYHDLLFEQQEPRSRWDFTQLARQASIDLSEFSRCLNTRQYAQEVEHDWRDAVTLGITSTPTFFINGRPLIGARSFDEFRVVIDKALMD